MSGAIGAYFPGPIDGAIGAEATNTAPATGQSNDIGAYRFTYNEGKTSDIGAYGRINPLAVAAGGYSVINIYYISLLQGSRNV
jgi:hypothetical protein